MVDQKFINFMRQNPNLPSSENPLTQEELATWERELDAALTFEDLKNVTASATESKKISPEVKASLDEQVDEAVLVDQNAENFIIAITNGSNPEQIDFKPQSEFDPKKNQVTQIAGNQGGAVGDDVEGFNIEKAIKKLEAKKPVLRELSPKLRKKYTEKIIKDQNSFDRVLEKLKDELSQEKITKAKSELEKELATAILLIKDKSLITKITSAIEEAANLAETYRAFDRNGRYIIPTSLKELKNLDLISAAQTYAETYRTYDRLAL